MVIFPSRRTPDFEKKRVAAGSFAGAFPCAVKKKFVFFVAVAQRVRRSIVKKVKKNFGGLEKGRIFAPAFERGSAPREGRREWERARGT